MEQTFILETIRIFKGIGFEFSNFHNAWGIINIQKNSGNL